MTVHCLRQRAQPEISKGCCKHEAFPKAIGTMCCGPSKALQMVVLHLMHMLHSPCGLPVSLQGQHSALAHMRWSLQAVSSRPDVTPPDYLKELEKLQDQIPPFPDAEAMQVRLACAHLADNFGAAPLAGSAPSSGE